MLRSLVLISAVVFSATAQYQYIYPSNGWSNGGWSNGLISSADLAGLSPAQAAKAVSSTNAVAAQLAQLGIPASLGGKTRIAVVNTQRFSPAPFGLPLRPLIIHKSTPQAEKYVVINRPLQGLQLTQNGQKVDLDKLFLS